MKKFLSTVFAAILLVLPVLAQNAPSVLKVEPPSWWANHTINPVRVLVSLKNINGLELHPVRKETKVLNARSSEHGDYIFFDLAIAKNSPPGSYPITLYSKTGKTEIPFEILAPLDSKTHFQGITNDDVIYLIMPDRFANGDTANDFPKDSSAAANDDQRGLPGALENTKPD